MRTTKHLLLICFILSVNIAIGQNLKYGFSYSKATSFQTWEYLVPENASASHTKEKQNSFEIYAILEKELNKNLSLKTELGYQQKGFKERLIDLQFLGGQQLTENVETNNLTLNIIGKLDLPFKLFNIYTITGINMNYLVSVNDLEFTSHGKIIENYNSFVFDEYKSVVFSGILGVGIEFDEIMFLEYRNNFPLMSSTKGSIKVKDTFSGITIGVYLNKLIEGKSESM